MGRSTSLLSLFAPTIQLAFSRVLFREKLNKLTCKYDLGSKRKKDAKLYRSISTRLYVYSVSLYD